MGGGSAALEEGRAEQAFRADMRRTRERGIRGFLPFDRLEERILRLAPDLERRDLPPVTAFVEAYGSVATREVGEVYGWIRAEARGVLEERVEAGELALDNTIMSNSLMVNEIQGEVRPWAPTTGDRRSSGGRSTPT